MEIHLNITFPKMPCELLTLDVMDVSGEQQHGVAHGVKKVRLRPQSQGGGIIDTRSLALHDEKAEHLDPNYCGECYGATAPATASKQGCCNTCDEVREAYATQGWAFGRGDGIEQCEREHYAEKLDEQREEGCRIEGDLTVNKVVGNFHLAPGRSFSNGNIHVHDLKNYWDTPNGQKHDFTHTIHQLRFGPQLPEAIKQKLGGAKAMPWTNHHVNPLDGVKQETQDPNFNYMYFVKIVPTSYLPLGWEKQMQKLVGIDGSADGSVETHQYSVTSHKRSLSGGNDAAEGHAERQHSRGGIPGVFFSYVSAPCGVHPSMMESALMYGTGHFAHEGHQPRGAGQDVSWLSGRSLRHRGRYADGCRCRGSWPVRGYHAAEEVALQGYVRSCRDDSLGLYMGSICDDKCGYAYRLWRFGLSMLNWEKSQTVLNGDGWVVGWTGCEGHTEDDHFLDAAHYACFPVNQLLVTCLCDRSAT